MNNLKDFSDEEIVNLIKSGKVSAADLTDSGICPSCFDRAHGNVLYGDDSSRTFYEDDMFLCMLIGNPRCAGHSIISTKVHYRDMTDIDDEVCSKAFLLSKRVMNAIKRVYGCESVYLCTMCDGPMNHFHIQFIPRYSYEKRGSKNFVKPRVDYVHDEVKLAELKKEMRG